IHARFVLQTVPTKFIVRQSQNWSSRDLNSFSKRSLYLLSGRLIGVLLIISVVVIAARGIVICYQAPEQTGLNLTELWQTDLETIGTTSSLAILAIGLLAGLRHALDVDHIAAVSTIVSDRKSLFSSLLIGGAWGIGHTASLLLAGVGVILLRIQIDKYE